MSDFASARELKKLGSDYGYILSLKLVIKVIYFSLFSYTIRLISTSVCYVIFLYDVVTLINIFMDIFINNLLFCEKREKKIFLGKEAKNKSFKRKEERETEWDASILLINL